MNKKTLTTDLYSFEGEKVGTFDLPESIFGSKINPELTSQAVRVYLANQRRGTANTKDRGDVSGGGKKPWKQKGTGRARQGSIRSPLWTKGGIAHGPHPHDFSLKLNKKMKKAALFSALSEKCAQNKLKVVEKVELIKPQTKKANNLLNKLEIKKGVLVIIPEKNDNIYHSFRNIRKCESMIASQINTYSVLKYDTILLLKDSLAILEKTFVDKKV